MADNEEHDISGMGSEDAEENEMLKKTRENWKRKKIHLEGVSPCSRKTKKRILRMSA